VTAVTFVTFVVGLTVIDYVDYMGYVAIGLCGLYGYMAMWTIYSHIWLYGYMAIWLYAYKLYDSYAAKNVSFVQSAIHQRWLVDRLNIQCNA